MALSFTRSSGMRSSKRTPQSSSLESPASSTGAATYQKDKPKDKPPTNSPEKPAISIYPALFDTDNSTRASGSKFYYHISFGFGFGESEGPLRPEPRVLLGAFTLDSPSRPFSEEELQEAALRHALSERD